MDNQDVVDVLSMRERQLTEMILMLQRKRRDVRAELTRYKARDLQPVSVAQKSSPGNKQVFCERCGVRWDLCSCQ